MIKNKKGQAKIDVTAILVEVVLLVALIPIIVIFSQGQQQCLVEETPYLQDGVNICSNMSVADETADNVSSTNSLSTTERTLLGLTGLFLILAFIFGVVKSSGLIGRKT